MGGRGLVGGARALAQTTAALLARLKSMAENSGSGMIGAINRLGYRLFTGACSFSGDTKVLMADGSTKPISEIQPGDKVYATDPETGEKGPRRVTRVWVHADKVVGLQIAGSTLTTTEDHPFWSETDQRWQRADAFDEGDKLLTADGTPAVVGSIIGRSETETVYNLTVAAIHTYYALTGDTPVLVHNSCGGRIEVGAGAADDLANFTPAGAEAEFVFDASSGRLLTGDVSAEGLSGSPHQQLARSLGANEDTVLGGTIYRENGRLVFTENSGHYGHRWTDDMRQQFQSFLSDKGIDFEYRPWG